MAATGFKIGLGLLRDRGLDRYIHILLHDEIVLITPAEQAQTIADALAECMVEGIERVWRGAGVKVSTPHIGRTWHKD